MPQPEHPEVEASGPEASARPAPDAPAEAAASEVARLNDRLLRLTAEFDNYKKRVARDRAEVIRVANEELLLELLPVLDNLERALAVARKTDSTEALAEGVDMVLRLFQGVLERAGVKPIDSVGQPFDPTVHQAVAAVESPEVPDQTVVEEVQRGYWLHAKVLRPAMVKVAKAAAPAGSPPEERNR